MRLQIAQRVKSSLSLSSRNRDGASDSPGVSVSLLLLELSLRLTAFSFNFLCLVPLVPFLFADSVCFLFLFSLSFFCSRSAFLRSLSSFLFSSSLILPSFLHPPLASGHIHQLLSLLLLLYVLSLFLTQLHHVKEEIRCLRGQVQQQPMG